MRIRNIAAGGDLDLPTEDLRIPAGAVVVVAEALGDELIAQGVAELVSETKTPKAIKAKTTKEIQ